MSTITKVSKIDDHVSEYKLMEDEVTKNFLQGVIKLGEILNRHKKEWFPKGQWLDYLGRIGKHVSGANQFIRIYKYSKKNMAQLLEANVTNWAKLNAFLALPEEIKEAISEEVKGKEVSTDEFTELAKEKVETGGFSEEVSTEVLGKDEIMEEVDMESLLKGASLIDINFAAGEMITMLNEKMDFHFSAKSKPIAEAYLHLVKAKELLTADTVNKVSDEEKQYWEYSIDKLHKEMISR